MNLLDSLLDAIVRLDGDALVMHVGEKPYVVTTSEAMNQFRGPLAWGQVELSTRVLTTDAVSGMLGQILPLDQRSTLDEFGATEYDVTAVNHADERFTIVAARGGDDIWVEMRRHPKVAAPAVTAPPPAQEAPRQDRAVAVAVAEPPVPHVAEPVAAAAPAPVGQPPIVAPVEAPAPAVEPAPLYVAAVLEPAHEDLSEIVEDVLIDSEPEVEIELPSSVELAAGHHEVPVLHEISEHDDVAEEHEEPLSIGIGLSLSDLENAAEEESIDLDSPAAESAGGLELDLEQELESAPFSLDAEVEAGILAATQEWGDDVMTEGELGELLRATASAVITGETLGVSEERHSSDHLASVSEPPAPEPAAAVAAPVVEPAVPVVVAEDPPEPEPAVQIAEEAPRAAAPPVEVPRVETPELRVVVVDGDASVSRETRELPALVEYQIERDRAAAAAAATPAATVEPPVPVAPVAAAEATDAKVNADVSVSSTEGVWPVSEDLTHDKSTSHAAPPAEIPIVQIAASSEEPAVEETVTARPAAVVLPLTRQNKGDGGGDGRGNVATNLQRLLRLAANRGAATVYVVANSAPLVRVDGEFSTLEGEQAISAAHVERLLAEVSPAGKGSTPPSAEWLIDVPEIGRVRCVTFRDHRGPGIILRMVPARAIAADQLGLSSEVQALCSEAEGLVLVTGGRDSGRSTLLSSFVDLVNRTRSDHIVTIEAQIDYVHESRRSFISQREVRGEEAMVGAVRSACREEPDVLVIEDVRSHDVAALALEAAESGRLVFASVPGLSTASAIERLIELFPAERREKAQASLAGTLRGVVSQVLLRKLRGGRVAAREVLLNTPAVASLIMEGKTFQLPGAIDNGRRAGMISFSDSLSALVREGVVHPSHAYRKAPSRDQLVAALQRDGVDTSIAERLG